MVEGLDADGAILFVPFPCRALQGIDSDQMPKVLAFRTSTAIPNLHNSARTVVYWSMRYKPEYGMCTMSLGTIHVYKNIYPHVYNMCVYIQTYRYIM